MNGIANESIERPSDWQNFVGIHGSVDGWLRWGSSSERELGHTYSQPAQSEAQASGSVVIVVQPVQRVWQQVPQSKSTNQP